MVRLKPDATKSLTKVRGYQGRLKPDATNITVSCHARGSRIAAPVEHSDLLFADESGMTGIG